MLSIIGNLMVEKTEALENIKKCFQNWDRIPLD